MLICTFLKKSESCECLAESSKQEARSHYDVFGQGGTEIIDWTQNNWFRKRPKDFVDGDLDGRIQVNLRKKPENFQYKSHVVYDSVNSELDTRI